MLISGLALPGSGSIGTLFGGVPTSSKSCLPVGQELGPREALYAWPTGEEGDNKVQPWARDRRRHEPFRCVESGWGREDLACRASSHGKTPGKFINVSSTHDWGTV